MIARERDGLLLRVLLLFSVVWLVSTPFEVREVPLEDRPEVDDPDPFAFLRIMAIIFWRGRRLERALLNFDLEDDMAAIVY